MLQDIIGKRIRLQQEALKEIENEIKIGLKSKTYLLGLMAGKKILIDELVSLYIIAGEGEKITKGENNNDWQR